MIDNDQQIMRIHSIIEYCSNLGAWWKGVILCWYVANFIKVHYAPNGSCSTLFPQMCTRVSEMQWNPHEFVTELYTNTKGNITNILNLTSFE